MRARDIDRLALVALALLIIGYSVAIGDQVSASAGPAWLAVAVILLGANVLRLRFGARPSGTGFAVGAACALLGAMRTAGLVTEVTVPIALITVLLPVTAARLMKWIGSR
jgi:hypothetical protein